MPDPITFRATFTSWTGYGQIATEVARQLEAMGHPVLTDDYGADDAYFPPDPWVTSRQVGDDHDPDRAIHLACPGQLFDPRPETLFFTMWESTGLPKGALPLLNSARAVVVPCRWNAENFRKAGVTRPIHLCPLGVDPELYYPRPMPESGPFVVGMAARISHGGVRKGIGEGVAAFLDAFGGRDDVELRVKLWDDCLDYISLPDDPRVKVQTTPMTPAMMAEWYAGIHVLLVPSKGEGWGLHTHQAMATGRPVIAARYSGTADFFDEDCGWELNYREEPARGLYKGAGNWCVPSHASMVRALREAFCFSRECPGDFDRLGRSAAYAVAPLTWANTARTLERILVAEGFLPAASPAPETAAATA